MGYKMKGFSGFQSESQGESSPLKIGWIRHAGKLIYKGAKKAVKAYKKYKKSKQPKGKTFQVSHDPKSKHLRITVKETGDIGYIPVTGKPGNLRLSGEKRFMLPKGTSMDEIPHILKQYNLPGPAK